MGKTFIYDSFSFDNQTMTAEFNYGFDGGYTFKETLGFSSVPEDFNQDVLNSALRLYFWLAGVSYFKLWPTQSVEFKTAAPDAQAATLLHKVYSYGMSQFLFENNLGLNAIPKFNGTKVYQPHNYKAEGIVALQSGGKDSLLTATILENKNIPYTPLYMKYGNTYPEVLDGLRYPLRTIERHVDIQALKTAQAEGGLNGHVPVTYIVMGLALIDAIIHNDNTILVSIGAEGEEPHGFIGSIPVNHQWSKTWDAEQLFAGYVHNVVSPDIHVGSPIRAFSELYIAEKFSGLAWRRFGHGFSSCNLANYKLGGSNRKLYWDGTCPKCANAFLLFAPFVEPTDLFSVIGGNLFSKPELELTFKGLLGIDGVMKPFECIGETNELRLAYHMARERWGDNMYNLPFDVPASKFDYKKLSEAQDWAAELIR